MSEVSKRAKGGSGSRWLDLGTVDISVGRDHDGVHDVDAPAAPAIDAMWHAYEIIESTGVHDYMAELEPYGWPEKYARSPWVINISMRPVLLDRPNVDEAPPVCGDLKLAPISKDARLKTVALRRHCVDASESQMCAYGELGRLGVADALPNGMENACGVACARWQGKTVLASRRPRPPASILA